MARGGEMYGFRFSSEDHLHYIQECIDRLSPCQVQSDFVPVEESDVLAPGASALSESRCVAFDRSEVDYAMQVQGTLRLGEHLRRLCRDTAQQIEQMVLSGSAGSLLAHRSVDRVSAQRCWSEMTPEEVLEETTRFVSGGRDDRLLIADTLLISRERFQFLARTPSPVRGRSLMELLREANEWTASTGKPLRIFGRSELAPVNLQGTQRLIAYRCGPDVLRVQMRPVRFDFPQLAGLRYLVPAPLEVGRLEIRRPELVRYLDDI